MEQLIKNALRNIKQELGFGHTEAIYREALAMELSKKYTVKQEVTIPIKYKKRTIGSCRCDIYCYSDDEEWILELKAILGDLDLAVKDQCRKYRGIFHDDLKEWKYCVINFTKRSRLTDDFTYEIFEDE